uniref:Putative secreted protein n=1 Tax=Anopheles darlingi TaxID=43151 RepID=A0A2M4DBJ0_ANODA
MPHHCCCCCLQLHITAAALGLWLDFNGLIDGLMRSRPQLLAPCDTCFTVISCTTAIPPPFPSFFLLDAVILFFLQSFRTTNGSSNG